MKIIIIDYGIGNTKSLINACTKIGLNDITLSDSEQEIYNSDLIILPGVGAFGNAMYELEKRGLVETIKNYSRLNKPIIGICLGMQLLFESSLEFGNHIGLGLIQGEVIKLPEDTNDKIPHVSWNKLDVRNQDSALYSDILNYNFFYFVHSYFCSPKNHDHILSTTNYAGIDFCSSVRNNNVFGFQFHPEKSSKSGLKLLKNFIGIVRDEYCSDNV